MVSDMKYTELLKNILLRAKQFAGELGAGQERIEYCFAALLKMAVSEELDKESIEYNRLKTRLEEICQEDLNTTERKVIECAATLDSEKAFANVEQYINIAKKYAVEDYEEAVTSLHLLEAILHKPTDFIKGFVWEGDEVIHLTREEADALIQLMENKEM